MTDFKLEINLLSSLEKIFADGAPAVQVRNKGTMLRNEVYSFQAAYHWNGPMEKHVRVQVSSPLSSDIVVNQVGLVPSEMPCYWDHDSNVLRTVPDLYPDILLPLEEGGITLLPLQWRSLWFTVDLRGEDAVPAGTNDIEIIFLSSAGEELGRTKFSIEVLEATLPSQKLIHTEWFHTDCISTYYGLEVFGEEHWRRLEQFILTAVKHGINMILTPVFTPPLDTAIGGERPTVQLVDVFRSGNTYTFGFHKLQRWIELCNSLGVRYFEFSHLFTQWGAMHAPKIMAYESGELKRIFGWETDAAGDEYKSFLHRFLPELLAFIEKNQLKDRCYFHISDEPTMKSISQYKLASSIVGEFLKDYPVIDALSDYEFYETGAVRHPIPSTYSIAKFIEKNVPDLWTYYCCGQYAKVSNRFFNMPSARNRILGMQLYKYKIKGFLHWGFNFWYSQYSLFPVDPFKVTDAACGFPSGDAFVVYPGESGPLVSIRLKVFFEALQDLRALEQLETQIGRAAVLEMLENGLETRLTFEEYPEDAGWLLNKREEINRRLSGRM